MTVRSARAAEVPAMAELWHEGWHEVHPPLVPPALTPLRTVQSFTERIAEALSQFRVTGPHGAPTGLCRVKDAEIDQLFVAPSARGMGTAQRLLDDGEARIRAAGHTQAWLYCAVGNAPAARFYEKHGWTNAATVEESFDTSEGPFSMTVWRFEKTLP